MPSPADPSTVRAVDLSQQRSVHIVGIGGAGMRAIARVLLAMGHRVSGSDRAASAFLDELAELGATVFVGHDEAHGAQADMVTRSTAVPDSNPDVAGARQRDIPVYSRAEILASIVAQRPGILIAGTHGKTTTSSMLAVLLDHAGLAPSFIIGADVVRFGTGARWDASEHFVVEADESDGTFLSLAGAHAVVTSLDPDHLEYYGTAQRLHAAFNDFVDGIAGVTAVCLDDPDTHALIDGAGVVSYGTNEAATLRISDIAVQRDATAFDVHWHGELLGRAEVGLPGHHNALNAAAALTIGLSLGVPFDTAAAGLALFDGVARRFESRGEHLGTRLVDDYAHLPAEVEAAIATARSGPWNRIVAAYQPHRFSRTEALGASFATSFRDVDHLVLTDIYSAGEDPRPGVTGRLVYDAVVEACPDLSVSWQPSLPEVTEHLAASLGPGDLALTLGAGDLTTVPDVVLDRLRASTPPSMDWLESLEAKLTNSTVRRNASIGELTTYRVGGAALALATVGHDDDLRTLVVAATENDVPLLMMGNGSNMLVADSGFWGLAIVLAGDFGTIRIDDSNPGQVTLGAAVSLPAAARQLVGQQLAGFEWAVGVPGTIGGAIAMNAGGHGSDMAASVVSVSVLDTRTGERSARSAADLQFGYRTSAITSHEIVLDATLQLAPGDDERGKQLLSEIVTWRRENQPGGQNAGSVFTNPPGDSAGRLIDAAGGKNLRVRSAEVSAKHANFIQVDPGGSANDVRDLMTQIVELVATDAQVELIPETRMVGFG